MGLLFISACKGMYAQYLLYLAMTQLVEALCYSRKGRWFNSRWCHWIFSFTYSFLPHCGSGVDSASNRIQNQEYFLGVKGGRCVRLTTLPPSHRKSNKMQQCMKILFHIYMKLNMFRATYRPSSGA